MSGISRRKINSRCSSRFRTENKQPSFSRSSIRCLRSPSTRSKTQRYSHQPRGRKRFSQDRCGATWLRTKRPSSVLLWKSTKKMRIKLLGMIRGLLRVSRILAAVQWLPRAYQAGWSGALSQTAVWIATIIAVMRALEGEVPTLCEAGKWRVKAQRKTAPSSAIAHLTITSTIRRLLTPMRRKPLGAWPTILKRNKSIA